MPQMRLCSNCHATNTEAAFTCIECGTRLALAMMDVENAEQRPSPAPVFVLPRHKQSLRKRGTVVRAMASAIVFFPFVFSYVSLWLLDDYLEY